ncbi:TauD/TfdA family dioxygenase [Capilliphycus salinus ALCB114379]|uniref:TauD/TfdA family dioxygenase n=1 Tax=Capilliphycus salinus TaxID=2768948 RepID=UPI0039A62ABE
MKTITELRTEPLPENVGSIIINANNGSIFDLDKESIINWYRHQGALLFRGFEADVETFTQFSNGLSTDFIDYTGGVFNRQVINGDSTVLTVNDFKNEIKLHGEMYYQKNIPLMLWFFCAEPPLQDRETILCDGKRFFDELSDSLKDLFGRKRLKYRGYLNKEGWKKRYKTDDLNEVKEICKSNDTEVEVNVDESINLSYICPAIYPSRTGEFKVFISSLLPAMAISPDVVCFDDGTKIDADILSELNEIADKITAEIKWQKGDILMVDNTRILHGRRAFADEEREIYIRLCSPAFSD